MITSRHRQLLKDAYQEIENQKHKTEKIMNEQQKQLQSILAEVGINLTENQTLAVMEANELLRCGDPSYSEVMEFKEKYAPKREKQGGVYIKGLTPNSFGWEPRHTKDQNDNLASHYNENNQPER